MTADPQFQNIRVWPCEEAAKLALMLRALNPRLLTPAQVDDLLNTFG